MKCPCKDCLCAPMCSIKSYEDLVECSTIIKYLIDPFYVYARPSNRVKLIKKFLQPTTWHYKICGDDLFIEKGEVPESG